VVHTIDGNATVTMNQINNPSLTFLFDGEQYIIIKRLYSNIEFSGDVTSLGNITTITSNKVSDTMLSNVNNLTFKGQFLHFQVLVKT
jgi:hypothetical protein